MRTRNTEEGFLTPEDFRIWRESRGLSLKEASAMLGLPPIELQRFETHGAPKNLALAIALIERRCLAPDEIQNRMRETGTTRIQCMAVLAAEHGFAPWRPTLTDRSDAKRNATHGPPTEDSDTWEPGFGP